MQQIPKSTSVAIIGGGIIGISAALALARRGVDVVVFEKGVVAGEQSSRNWGWIRSVGRNPAELPLSAMANDMWQDIQSGVDVGYRRTGLAYLAASESALAAHQAWLDIARESGANARILSKGESARLIPSSRRTWAGALYSSTDGVAEPTLATQGIAALAVSLGAKILEGCAARGLDVSAGRVSGVVTEHGLVKCSSVVLAGGAWSRLLCGNHGIEFPQLKVHASGLQTTPVNAGLDLAINGGDFTVRKRSDGGYTVSKLGASVAELTPDSIRLSTKFMGAWVKERKYLRLRIGRRFFDELKTPRRFGLDRPTPFEACRTLDPEPNVRMLDEALKQLKSAFAGFSDALPVRAWAGMIDVTPDALPVISEVSEIPGFFLGSGFSGHGFGIGPAAGSVLANLVTGDRPVVEVRDFSLTRFSS
ncbi:NAD(P)/FAD-dependent oxidoreductase [Paraburkholderia sabiae]|uniref:FAD-binding oxidoreductase n=1 Tax=Paraburkholderia sabiae TaxID=273251 RepID=A0ABU9QRI8_9BURK|nr:FAD-binding oxidoreductase [Paraburkholderia sabiae]WJZ79533.1 FAD-binding oxidoreductase [Paraburkholderia sabiae]CAD6562978.1 4-methylaminobutanoate oxidase (formaldehyde-forming) [Paraburkholderia sabiae]